MEKDARTQALYSQFLNFRPSKGDLRKIAILESAIDCIATIGVEGCSFEAIGRPNKMTKAHVAYYFKDRNDILKAAIRFVVATAQSFTVEHVKAAASDQERLSAFINGTFAWREAYPKHAPVILLLYYYAGYDAFFRDLHHEVRELGARRLEAVVAPLLPARRRREALALAKLVQAILTGHLLDHQTTHPVLSLEKLRKRVLHDVHLAVAAYRTPGSYTDK